MGRNVRLSNLLIISCDYIICDYIQGISEKYICRTVVKFVLLRASEARNEWSLWNGLFAKLILRLYVFCVTDTNYEVLWNNVLCDVFSVHVHCCPPRSIVFYFVLCICVDDLFVTCYLRRQHVCRLCPVCRWYSVNLLSCICHGLQSMQNIYKHNTTRYNTIQNICVEFCKKYIYILFNPKNTKHYVLRLAVMQEYRPWRSPTR